MKILSNLKKIDGLIYKLSINDTLKSMAVNDEIIFTKHQATYPVTNGSIRWLKSKDSSYNFTIEALDKFQDKYIVRRIPAK